MIMKTKHMILSAAGLILAAACSREAAPESGMHCTLFAETSPQSKTVLENKSVLWLDNDAIAVFADGKGSSLRFETAKGGRTAAFTGILPYGTGSVTAVYPWNENVRATASGFSVSLPEEQKAVAGSFDDDLAFMVSEAALDKSTAKLHFRQVCGLVKFSVGGEDVVSARLEGAALAGDAEVKSSDASATVKSAKNLITLAGASETLAKGDYYFTCYPFEGQDLKLVYTTTTSTKTKELGGVTLERAGIYTIEGSDADMLPDDWQPAGLEVKAAGQTLTETAEGSHIYEGEVSFDASCSFTVTIGEDEYGFTALSGAGGIGEVRNMFCGLPYYNIGTAATEKSDFHYTVSRAIGLMSLKSDGGNDFFYSAAGAGKVFVRIDNSGDKPVYYFRLVAEEENGLIFHEDFDLCTNGGDYMVAMAGTDGNLNDGVTPGTKSKQSANNPAFTFDYPEKVTKDVPKELYISQRGLEGWTFEFAGERPGAMQLASGSVAGRMVTPALAGAGSGCDAVLTLDIARFSSSSTDNIYVRLLGGGTIVSGHVETEAYAAAGTAAVSSDFQVGAAEFAIADSQYCPHSLTNGDKDKPHSVYTFQLSGITSDTKIEIDAAKGKKNAPRCFVFDIKVVKK